MTRPEKVLEVPDLPIRRRGCWKWSKRTAMRFAVYFLLCLMPLLAQPEDLARKSHRAKDLMAAGQFQEAIPVYRELVRAAPDNPGLIMDLGLALDMAGYKREAVREFEAALRLDPRQAPAWLFLGTAHLDLGEPAKAIEPVERALKIQPDNLDAQEAMAEVFLAVGRFEQAAERFRKLLESNAQNSKVWYGLGLAYQDLAQRNFDGLEKVAPGSAYWLDLVGESRLKVRQYNSAFFFYRQALAKMPSMRGVHAALAEVYRNTGHPDWAAIEEDKESRIPPPDCSSQRPECDFLAGRYSALVASPDGWSAAESYYWRTRAYNKLSLEAFSRLGQLPPSAEMHELVAKIHFDQRQYDESAREWREALKLSPGNPYARKELALSLIQGGDRQAAEPLLRELLKQSPGSVELNNMMGDTLLDLQKAEEAIPFLKRAVQLEPKLLPARRTLGRAYLQLGQPQQAIPHLKAALPIDDDGNLHYLLARAYQTTGQAELAKAAIRDYQEMAKSAKSEEQATEQQVEITPP
ncbi:MAG: hypothetical protein DMG26_10020 [Acidobacteria bacterium]|nr:MAG: hypothetical protein DMG26_10020 [Acidobacteriota bacterium]